MATAEQIKSLIRCINTDDKERGYAIALQVAAHEARQGHVALARDLRAIIDKDRQTTKRSLKIIDFPKDLTGLVLLEQPETDRASLIIDAERVNRIDRVITEYYQRSKLQSHGLSHRRKLLLLGLPGTGKTMTARVLAHELKMPLYIIQVDRLVTKFMGETSAKLRQIFDMMKTEVGVYLFDEFDAIGGERSLDNDVGEMRRVLNAFLQFIEQDRSDSLIVAATNNSKLLDRALFRRFDDVLHYQYPSAVERRALIENILGTFLPKRFSWKSVINSCEGLSHAEIDSACRDAIKTAILSDRKTVTSIQLKDSIRDKQGAYSGR